MHKLFCIIGRTGSGKSTLTKMVADELGLKILKSYTTRPMRANETEENSDHIFISPEEVEKYRDDMVAYTERVNYCSFATKQQIMESDFYIVNPSGYYELCEKTKDMDINLIPIDIVSSFVEIMKRILPRGECEVWMANCIKEDKEFRDYERKYFPRYFIGNEGNIENALSTFKEIVIEELKNHKREPRISRIQIQ